MKHKLVTLVLAVVVIISLVFVGCAKPAPTAEQPIKIGALVPLTGPHAMWGEMFMNAFEFALDEAGHEVVGRPIEFIVEDEGGPDAAMALDKAKKLVGADKVDLIMGPFYGSSAMAVMPYTSSLPLINVKWSEPCARPEEIGNKYAFWIPPSYSDNTYPVGLYAYDEMGFRTATTIGTDFACGYDFMQGFTDAFTARGGKVIQQQWSPMMETDYTPYLSGLEMADAMVLSLASVPDKLVFIEQYNELGLFGKMPILISEVGTFPPAVRKQLGDMIIGIIGVNKYLPALDNPENKKFLPAYMAKYNEEPDDKVANAYNGMRVVLAALEATGGDTDPDTLKQALLKLKLEFPTGHFEFCPGRIGVHDLRICEMQKVNGNLTWVELKIYPATEPYIKTYP